VVPLAVRKLHRHLALLLTFAEPGRHAVHVADVRGRTVFATTVDGIVPLEITDLRKGLHVVRVKASDGAVRALRVVMR
jgi:hypothetical protein